MGDLRSLFSPGLIVFADGRGNLPAHRCRFALSGVQLCFFVGCAPLSEPYLLDFAAFRDHGAWPQTATRVDGNSSEWPIPTPSFWVVFVPAALSGGSGVFFWCSCEMEL